MGNSIDLMEIWYSNIKNISEHEFQKLLQDCSPEEQDNILRYRFLKDRLFRLIGYQMVKLKYGVTYEQISRSETGKPFLKTGQKFNISHSCDIVSVVFSTEEVGIDLEIKSPLRVDEFIGYFHPKEREYLLKEIGNKQRDVFYHIWTRKEAFLKAIGTGIVNGLNNENCLDSSILYKNNRYNIYTTSFLNDYTLSICEKNNEILGMESIDFKEVLIHELYTL